MPRKIIFLLLFVVMLTSLSACSTGAAAPLGMAVEFNDHAACAYLALEKGWYRDAGLDVRTYESYVTGVALAAALTRGDIQVAYICLTPAIIAYKNGGVPLKIVCGTHKYGYGLVVNPAIISTVADLAEPGMRIGCVNEGAATDIVLHKTIHKFNLDKENVLKNVQRMSPPKQLISLQNGQLDAVFVPEHWATLARSLGFHMLLRSQDVWPEMQGSVLAVKADLLANEPSTVRQLVDVSKKATDWINQHREESAAVLCLNLNGTQGTVLPHEAAQVANQFELTPEILLNSLSNLEYTTGIDTVMVQGTIDYLASLGYISESFPATDILDLRFIPHE